MVFSVPVNWFPFSNNMLSQYLIVQGELQPFHPKIKDSFQFIFKIGINMKLWKLKTLEKYYHFCLLIQKLVNYDKFETDFDVIPNCNQVQCSTRPALSTHIGSE